MEVGVTRSTGGSRSEEVNEHSERVGVTRSGGEGCRDGCLGVNVEVIEVWR